MTHMEPTDGGDSRKLWLKAELHAHCSLDPADCRICPHSPEDLIERAAALGYRVLAITCHNLDIWTPGLAECARSRGIVLVPGMEVADDDGRHVLAYNFRAAPEELDTLAKIRARSGRDTLVIAPHPFYPGPMSLRERLASNADAFDAVEYSGFRVRGLDFNRRAAAFARGAHKPLVGFGDVHYLWQLDRTFTWIYAEPEVSSIVSAVKRGLVRVETSPLGWEEAAAWWAATLWRCAFGRRPAPPATPEPEVR